MYLNFALGKKQITNFNLANMKHPNLIGILISPKCLGVASTQKVE